MSDSERHAVNPIAGAYIVREPKSGRGRYDVDTYVPFLHAAEVRHFACWKTPRGWTVFCFTFGMDFQSNPAARLGDVYAPRRRPDIRGSIHHNVLGSIEMHVIRKTRGPYDARSRDINRVLRAVLAD